MYEELPKGVAFPASTSDIQSLVTRANKESFSITARGAGTSLAGQATGNGVIMDVSRYMTDILDLNAENRLAHVQPGVIRDTLNREAGKHGLLFGPDTATTNRCMLGGMIGNNSCGSFSIKYKTTREHTLEIEAVLSDGSTALFKPLNEQELEQKKRLDNLEGRIYRGMLELIDKNRERILEAYPHPEIIRRNTGYALDRLCTMQPFNSSDDARPFNLAELLCGSEGTLAMTASAKVQLVAEDPHSILLIPHFESIGEAMKAAVEIVNHDPAAVELVDHVILDATRDNLEQQKNRFFLVGEPHCILIVQLDGKHPGKLRERADRLQGKINRSRLSNSIPIIRDSEKIQQVWELRKAGLGLLMGLGSNDRTPSFCEDTAVRVEDLPDYIEEFQQLLDRFDTRCVFYAHASVGELHLRPVIDTQTREGVQKMKAMAEEIAVLVQKYRGSLSGEHGDGRARSPYIEKVLGPEMMPLLQQVKELWDPKYLFNPGKIIQPEPIDAGLRFSPSYKRPDLETRFNWRKEGSFADALELCNGAGVCRKLADSGGTMCPSYMATHNEKDSTRGRANLFRQLFSGRGREAFTSEELKDALDLCLSCKACKSECPANVDMARMKAEFMQGWHRENGITLSERFFGQAGKVYFLAARFPNISNRLLQTPVIKEVLYHFANIHRERDLPEFSPEPFHRWYNKNHTVKPAQRKVVLLTDLFTNYHEPSIARSAYRVLHSLGYDVVVPGIRQTGRTQISQGLLGEAEKLANNLVPKFYRWAKQDIPIVGLEPSEILTLRDEYPDLCEEALLDKAKKVAEHSYQFEEFIVQHTSSLPGTGKPATPVYLHGHCHTKALTGDGPMEKALALAGYRPVNLDTGCCGMAGSFGYEADHYDVSMEIGNLVLFPAIDELPADALICAAGFSCRHQIKYGTGKNALHPAELIAQSLSGR